MNTRKLVRHYSRTHEGQKMIILASFLIIALISFFLPLLFAVAPLSGS